MEIMDAHVAGEPAAMVLAAMRDYRIKPASDGMAHFSFHIKPDSAEGEALMRAFARMVGRLTTRDLLEELETGVRPRTERQRRADALVELIGEAAAALEARATTPGFQRTPPSRR